MNPVRYTLTSLVAILMLVLAACSQPAAPAAQPPKANEPTQNTQALVWQFQTVDGVGDYISMALDSSGNPVISYRDRINGDLKLVHCGNATCTSGNTIQTVDSAGDVGQFTSLELDSSGNPVISYHDIANRDLKLVHCGNATCSSGNTIQTVDSAGNVGWYTSLALDSSGNPVISYYDSTNFDLKLVHCGNATCTSGNTIQTVDSAGDVGEYTSLALDSSGNPVISYFDNTNRDLKLVHCGNVTCSSGNTIQTLDSAGDVGFYTSLALDSSGNPVISYFDIANRDLKLVHCGNATCTAGNTIRTVDSAGAFGLYTSLELNSSGNPVISYYDGNNFDLKLVHCGNATCSSGNTFQTLDSAGDVGEHTSLKLDSSGNPVIAYRGNGSLKLARQVDDSTPPTATITLAPGQAPITNTSPIRYRITFSEPITGFDSTDLTLIGGALSTSATITEIAPNNSTTFDIALSGMSNNGSATFFIPAGRLTDLAGNPNPQIPAGANVTYDPTPPHVTLQQSPSSLQRDPTSTNPLRFLVFIDGDAFANLVGFEVADFSLSGTADLSNATMSFDPDNSIVSVSGVAGNGTVTLSIAAGAFTDRAGNPNTVDLSRDRTITFVTDTTPPVITPNISGTLGTNDWYTSNVNVTWTLTDPEFSISNHSGCVLYSVTSDTTGVSFTCSATSAGGTSTKTVTIKRDTTNPTIAFAGRTAPNPAGWNNTDVTLNWTCTDATSGVVNASIPQTLSNQGANQSSTASCTDNAGNTASNTQTAINIDKTAPTLSPVVSPNPVLLNGSATVTSGAADALSGIASQSCGALNTSTGGIKQVTCTATDNAGNTNSATASYEVKTIFNFSGFLQPVDPMPTLNQVNAGRSIPIKFSLSGNQGLNIFAAGSPSSQTIACNDSTPTDDVEETSTAGNSSLSYNPGSDTYHYVWKTEKSWAGTCRQLSVKLSDGMTYKANFKFR